jgi:hypothetical protein
LEDISDVAMPNVQIPTKRSLRLSADLDSGAMPAASDPTTNITELALRRSALEGIKDLLKKDVT